MEHLKSMERLSSIRDSKDKFLLNLIRRVRIGFLTLGHKGEEVVINNVRNVLVASVVRNIWVNVWLKRVIAFVVENMAITLMIVL